MLFIAVVFALSIVSYDLLVKSPPKASAAATVDTSTTAGATDTSYQRKTFYDSTNSLYWAFYNTNSAIGYANSSNGTSWTNRGSTGVATSDFSVWYSSGKVFLVYLSSGVQTQTGTLGATSISWGGTTAADSNVADGNTNISQDNAGNLWVAYRRGGTAGVLARLSTSANSTSAWGAEKTVASGTTNDPLLRPIVIPLTTNNNMLFIFEDDNSFALSKGESSVVWNSGSSSFSASVSLPCGSSDTTTFLNMGISAVASASDTANVACIQDNQLKYSRYSSGAWGTAVILDSGSTSDSPSISIDTVTGNLYTFWVDTSVIKYKKGVSPYASGNWDASPTTFFSTGTNTSLTTSYQQGGGGFQAIWTQGTGSPWNVEYQALALNATPAAPTLSAPSSGATGVSVTPQFQLRTTDADSDYLRYKIDVCSTSNCSSIVRTIDETSSQTGWTGQDQQTATAYTGAATIGSSTMASHTYQTAALSPGTQYWWRGYAIDPGGTNTFSSASSIQSFTTNNTSGAPTLLSPESGSTGQLTTPLFQLKATDAESDYLKYKILLYNSDCSTGLQTFDQTASQNGWLQQNQQNSTAYTGGTSLGASSTAFYGGASLSASTTYCWKAASIDPGGSNTFSSYSATQLFTTGAASSGGVIIQGGGTVTGGSIVR